MNDNELREFCISNYGADIDCNNCPYQKECNDFMERHEGNTPLFG